MRRTLRRVRILKPTGNTYNRMSSKTIRSKQRGSEFQIPIPKLPFEAAMFWLLALSYGNNRFCSLASPKIYVILAAKFCNPEFCS